MNISAAANRAAFRAFSQLLKKYKLITGAKSPYKYVDLKGETHELAKDINETFKNNSSLRDEIYQRVSDAYVMSYKTPDSLEDDNDEVNVDTNED
jgi:hypothetical protein